MNRRLTYEKLSINFMSNTPLLFGDAWKYAADFGAPVFVDPPDVGRVLQARACRAVSAG